MMEASHSPPPYCAIIQQRRPQRSVRSDTAKPPAPSRQWPRRDVLDGPGRREAAGSRHSLLLILGRRWRSRTDIAPRVQFLFLVRNLFERRLIALIEGLVIFLLLFSARRFV